MTRRHLSWSALLATTTIAVSSGSAHSYEIAAVSGGGTIESTVVYRGDVPTKKITPTKDTAVCGAPRKNPMIRVAADQAVPSAVVYLVDVGAGKAWPEPGAPLELDNIECRFEPEAQAVALGMMNIVNSNPVLHYTHGYYGTRTAFNLALPNKDQRIPTELSRAGAVRVDCYAHGWLEDWIYVVDNPYCAVTGTDGKFSITDVPPGGYMPVAVQPFTGPIEMPVTVASGQATDKQIELKNQ